MMSDLVETLATSKVACAINILPKVYKAKAIAL